MVDRGRLAELLQQEREQYAQRNPLSGKAYASAEHLFGRVPMTWMNMRAGAFPLYLDSARGAQVRDLDGHDYVDFSSGTPPRWPGTPRSRSSARCSAGSASSAAPRRCCRPRTPSGSVPS